MRYTNLIMIFTLAVMPCTFRSVAQTEKVFCNFEQDIDSFNFPKDFLFGVSASSPKDENTWVASGKGNSVWDYMTSSYTALIQVPANVDVASDFYRNYKEDVRLARSMNSQIFKFSLSWPKMLPNGFTNHINKDGVQFYKDVIDDILANGMKPMVTLFHWDLPKNMQKMGGLVNPLFADWFEQYARFVFTTFGDKVKYWLTINELNLMCFGGYGGFFEPLVNITGITEYVCGHYVILAHAKVYHLYDREFRPKQNGKIGYSIDFQHGQPENPSLPGDLYAVENQYQWYINWMLHPVFSSDGDYPPVMKERIGNRSRLQGFSSSRLPSFTKEQIHYVRGTSDFLGVTYLTYEPLNSIPSGDISVVSFKTDCNATSPDPVLELKDAPLVFRELLHRLHEEYHPTIYITANGFPEKSNNDSAKVAYLRGHIAEVLKAIQNGIDVQAYVVWSLVDTLELQSNLERKFGLVHVDFTNTNFTRTVRQSGEFIAKLFRKARCLY